ncbi:MAG: 30S ribosomal protein S12 methylthiotransferase RimO [Deltaproteobacteria bacterium HGW-Deltaproteobacteria-7]|nr:MAG: 30S ribosomal protein S12 methylthiotransferase RimO [Deltaproteobacteria bacterium HGW-Deltaproteobacteria-7]PKN50624.1 MAG: 30S ribosomal protein S12 methylthiotransferase RimO [Deltaproteobacteria bacterium HGW-Deltaproteobacteria-13]
MNQRKVHIISLGCPKNLIDSEVMGGLLNKSGHQVVDHSDSADTVIVNTCAFINPAKEEALEEILTLAEEKKRNNPQLQIVVAGCLAQRYGKELFAQIPEVDLFIGTGQVGNIVNHIDQLNQEKFKRSAVITKPDFLMNSQHPRLLPSAAASAYLKISDGCSNACSYCVIPSIRGPVRSRKPDDILQEAEILARRGIKEIIITAQDTTAYGRDLKGRPQLSSLLNDMAKIESVKWIRLLYAHPARVTTDLLSVIAAHEKICSYIDLPIQHIDDDVLKMMNRKVTGAEIRKVIAQAREIIRGVALRTSLIVGFPGETGKRFKKLADFVNEIKFDHLGVFTYSKEESTIAANLKSQVSEKEKERRREIIMNEQAAISGAINKTLIGAIQEVLIEEKSDRSGFAYIGRCSRQAPEIDGVTYIKKSKARIGEILKCRITAADDYDLFGEIIK